LGEGGVVGGGDEPPGGDLARQFGIWNIRDVRPPGVQIVNACGIDVDSGNAMADGCEGNRQWQAGKAKPDDGHVRAAPAQPVSEIRTFGWGRRTQGGPGRW
jgi:hypothetical protein